MAKNGDYHERLKSVRQLSRIDHLKGEICVGAVFAFQKFNPLKFLTKQIGTINIWHKCVTHAQQSHWRAIFQIHDGSCLHRILAQCVHRNH